MGPWPGAPRSTADCHRQIEHVIRPSVARQDPLRPQTYQGAGRGVHKFYSNVAVRAMISSRVNNNTGGWPGRPLYEQI